MLTSTQILKNRVAACRVYVNEYSGVKGFVPGIRAKLIALYPEYNTSQGGIRISNVLSGRSSDLQLTAAIELLTNEYLQSVHKTKAGIAVPA